MRRVRGGRIDVCSLDRKTPGNAWPRSKTDTILTSEFETRLEVGLSRGIEISLSKIDCNNLQRGPSFCNPSKGTKISNDQRYAAHEAMLRGLWPFRPEGAPKLTGMPSTCSMCPGSRNRAAALGAAEPGVARTLGDRQDRIFPSRTRPDRDGLRQVRPVFCIIADPPWHIDVIGGQLTPQDSGTEPVHPVSIARLPQRRQAGVYQGQKRELRLSVNMCNRFHRTVPAERLGDGQ